MVTGGCAPRAPAKVRTNLVANDNIKPGTAVRWSALAKVRTNFEAEVTMGAFSWFV